MNVAALVLAAACGIHFSVPRGWVVHVTHPESNICEAGVSPRNWEALVEKARWPDADEAVSVSVVTGSLDDAADVAGFFRDENGRLMTGDRGREFPPTPTMHSGLSGWEMSGWSRGYAKEGVDLGDGSRLTSNTFYSVLLKRSKRSYIVVRYEEGNPDIPSTRVDRVKAAKLVLRTIRPR